MLRNCRGGNCSFMCSFICLFFKELFGFQKQIHMICYWRIMNISSLQHTFTGPLVTPELFLVYLSGPLAFLGGATIILGGAELKQTSGRSLNKWGFSAIERAPMKFADF